MEIIEAFAGFASDMGGTGLRSVEVTSAVFELSLDLAGLLSFCSELLPASLEIPSVHSDDLPDIGDLNMDRRGHVSAVSPVLCSLDFVSSNPAVVNTSADFDVPAYIDLFSAIIILLLSPGLSGTGR